ncbi:unnamed protein product [Microthlaspi erraticum]|uniref:Reverse transcriptase zinc-binding domain-containing protein n=1 Tax=Microthlaspi erraticum TaxID=1685480 RepID=A0A6D2KXU3_9BRAS|nr:unnamed protein product [Microthlaspi erraticum]
MRVSDIINDQTRDWNIEEIQRILPHHLRTIQTIRPSKKGATDSYLWLSTKTGEYTVKTGYFMAMQQNEDHTYQPDHLNFNWNAEIWHAKFSQQMKVFSWKVIQRALPLGENLMNRGLLDAACCIHCGELETTDHLFFHSGFAKEVWNLASFSITLNHTHLTSFIETLKTAKNWICLPPTGVGA